jgi:hypothetical protein
MEEGRMRKEGRKAGKAQVEDCFKEVCILTPGPDYQNKLLSPFSGTNLPLIISN